MQELTLKGTLARVSAQTEFDQAAAMGLSDTSLLSNSFSPERRKKIHDVYWDSFVYQKIFSHLESFRDFDAFWHFTNRQEIIYGSGAVRQVANRFSARSAWLMTQFALSKLAANSDAFEEFVAGKIGFDAVRQGRRSRVTINEAIQLRKDTILETVRKYLGDSSLLIDLGSGWGRYSSLISAMEPGVSVVAAELSNSGRKSTELVAKHFGLNIETAAFDFYNWKSLLRKLQRAPHKYILVFSNHAIEQITYLDKRMFTDLLDLGKRICFVHIEPVGWQLGADERFSRPPSRKLGAHGGYNKNFVPIVASLVEEGRVRLLDCAPNYFSTLKRHNTGTLLAFEAIS